LEVLLASGYEFCIDSLEAQTDLMCLIRAISCTQVQNLLNLPLKHKESAFKKTEVGFINFRQFMTDVLERPFKWWQQHLSGFIETTFENDKGYQANPVKISDFIAAPGS
jgi:hypothetical protein